MSTETYAREGKHTVRVGDLVSVEGNPDGLATTRGWRNGRVVRFWTDATGALIADVTKPRMAGVRTVRAERLTRQNGAL